MRYRCIDVRIWGDEKFRSLSPLQPSGQGLFLYLLTNPNTTSIPGLYRAGAAAMAEELGWQIEDFKGAFDELIQQGLAKADLSSRVIYIPNAIKYNKPQSPNVIKSWVSHWDEIPECELKNLAYHELKAFIEGMGEGFGKAFREAFGEALGKPSLKAILNQEQEQEQELDPDQEVKICKVSSETSPQSVSDNSMANTEERETPTRDSISKESNSDVLEIFHHWQVIMNHPQAKFDPNRKKVILSARKKYSVEELKLAIVGCANTPFNMGQNTHAQKYDSIELIFRDAEHIERFIRNASPNGQEIVALQNDIFAGAI